MQDQVRKEALLLFRGAYGRLCVLSAQALLDGYHLSAIQLAARGQGVAQANALTALRRARAVVTLALDNARHAGNDTGELVTAGKHAKKAVEQEFSVHIPIYTVT